MQRSRKLVKNTRAVVNLVSAPISIRFCHNALLAALVNHPALAGEPDGPGIALRGSIETREYEGLVVQGRERLVGPDDTMWEILVREKGLPANRFRSYLVIMRRLNPNKMIGERGLRVGDKLFVPLQLDQLIGAPINDAAPLRRDRRPSKRAQRLTTG